MSTTDGHVGMPPEGSLPRPPPVVADSFTSVGATTERASESLAAHSESPFPLNSRRLTGVYLKCIARVPTSGSADETRVMISGSLARQPPCAHARMISGWGEGRGKYVCCQDFVSLWNVIISKFT